MPRKTLKEKLRERIDEGVARLAEKRGKRGQVAAASTKAGLKLAKVAQDQYDQFHEFSEDDPQLAKQIERYWKDIGLKFPGTGQAWSAVFVSWCALTAGSTKGEFPFSPQHSFFVNRFIKNMLEDAGVFRAYPIQEVAPDVGDIIQNNREGNAFDFEYAASNASYSSHSAIVTERGADADGAFVMTIGGNESDSIRRKAVLLTADGLVKQRPSNPYICVVKNLG